MANDDRPPKQPMQEVFDDESNNKARADAWKNRPATPPEPKTKRDKK